MQGGTEAVDMATEKEELVGSDSEGANLSSLVPAASTATRRKKRGKGKGNPVQEAALKQAGKDIAVRCVATSIKGKGTEGEQSESMGDVNEAKATVVEVQSVQPVAKAVADKKSRRGNGKGNACKEKAVGCPLLAKSANLSQQGAKGEKGIGKGSGKDKDRGCQSTGYLSLATVNTFEELHERIVANRAARQATWAARPQLPRAQSLSEEEMSRRVA